MALTSLSIGFIWCAVEVFTALTLAYRIAAQARWNGCLMARCGGEKGRLGAVRIDNVALSGD
jgi:hypothetical protein